MRHTMKVAAVMSVAALTLAACGDSGNDPGTSGSSSSTTKKSDLKVGMAYDVGGRGDQSFNDAAAAGLDKAKTELGVDTKEAAAVNGENEAAREERLQQLIDAGYTHVVAVGFAYAASVGKAAKDNPDVHFAIVDDASDDSKGANVDQITFAENEGSFLVGAAAALKSKSGHIGFVGGVNVPLIKKFEAGYIAGAKAVNPAIKIDSQYLTQPPDFSGFGDPAKGKTAAEGMYQKGADIVYHAAGGSGGGVFTAAKAAGKLGHRCRLRPGPDRPGGRPLGVIMTSMIKKVDVAVYDFIKSASRRQGAHRQQRLRPQGRRCGLLHDRWSGRRHQGQARRLQGARSSPARSRCPSPPDHLPVEHVGSHTARAAR